MKDGGEAELRAKKNRLKKRFLCAGFGEARTCASSTDTLTVLRLFTFFCRIKRSGGPVAGKPTAWFQFFTASRSDLTKATLSSRYVPGQPECLRMISSDE